MEKKTEEDEENPTDSVLDIEEKIKADRTHFSLPVSHQGPHENNIAQCGDVSSFHQYTVSLVARLSFSSKTGFIH